MAYVITAKVRQNGQPVARTVRAYDADTGALLDETVSDAMTGVYTLTVPDADPVYVMALPGDGFLPVARGPIAPTFVP